MANGVPALQQGIAFQQASEISAQIKTSPLSQRTLWIESGSPEP